MKAEKYAMTAIFLSLSLTSHAQQISSYDVPSIRDISPQALDAARFKNQATGASHRLRYREIKALNLSQSWQDKNATTTLGEGGRVIYQFGETIHSVICSPLNICDIELQAGETVRGYKIGDKVRWKVEPAVSGADGALTTHIIVKPVAPKLDTTMVVTTDKRTYHFNLKSTTKGYMASIAFTYPDTERNSWQQYYAQLDNKIKKKSLDVQGYKMPIDDLDFDYHISGDKPAWTPVRVYNDGVKTYIQMPKAMAQTEAPTFLTLDQANDEQIVNYRVREDKYIIDQVFDKGVLITGVGRKQDRVTISRNTPNRRNALVSTETTEK